MTVYFPTISPAEFEKALRICCLRQAARDVVHPTINPFTHGDEFAVRYGPFLVDVAKQAGLTLPQARRRMKVLQNDGLVLRDDAAGGRTRWWLAGLSAELRPAAQPTSASTPARQTLTHVTVPARQHWSDVLGVPRDCSTSEARTAFQSAVAALDQADPDYPNQSRRVRDAIDACCRDHEIQIEE